MRCIIIVLSARKSRRQFRPDDGPEIKTAPGGTNQDDGIRPLAPTEIKP